MQVINTSGLLVNIQRDMDATRMTKMQGEEKCNVRRGIMVNTMKKSTVSVMLICGKDDRQIGALNSYDDVSTIVIEINVFAHVGLRYSDN